MISSMKISHIGKILDNKRLISSRCEKDGYYVFTFDDEHSTHDYVFMMNSKDRVVLVDPDYGSEIFKKGDNL